MALKSFRPMANHRASEFRRALSRKAWQTFIGIDRGPGYRVYFGWDGKTLAVLLGGGTKRRQQRDIAEALTLWRLYKARKVSVRRR